MAKEWQQADSEHIKTTSDDHSEWYYGRIKNNVRVQDARLQQLLVSYQNVVLRAAQEAEDAMSAFLRTQEAATFRTQSAQTAQRSVNLALVQYSEGDTDWLSGNSREQKVFIKQ